MPAAGLRAPLTPAQALAFVDARQARTAILVEGWSDEAALEAVAATAGIALAEHGVIVLALGGVTNIGRFATELQSVPRRPRLCGLYDASEEAVVLRQLRRIELPAPVARSDAEGAGFFACDRDLEDELIRAAGAAAVEELLALDDDLASFRRFQRQPEQRDKPLAAQLHRFMGTRAGRKERVAWRIAAALPATRVPAPLRALLQHALGRDQRSEPANSAAAGVAKR